MGDYLALLESFPPRKITLNHHSMIVETMTDCAYGKIPFRRGYCYQLLFKGCHDRM